MKLPWSRHSFHNRKTHACLLVKFDVIKPESHVYNFERSPHGDYKRLAQRKSFIFEVMTEQNCFLLAAPCNQTLLANVSHNAFVVGFQDEPWSKVTTFDETQITSSVDRDPFHNHIVQKRKREKRI